MIKFIKKYNNIMIFFLIQIMIIGFCIYGEVYSNDELWCFQNICKMINGYKIYVDANVIQTPIFFFIGYLILKLLGANLLVFRLYNFAIMTIFLYITYLVIKNLIKNRYRVLIYFLLVTTIALAILTGSANYNEVALLFVLLGIYLNLIWCKKEKDRNILQATIMFLIIFSKQNIGLYYVIGIVAYQIISKKNLLDILKQMFFVGIETLILLLIFYKKKILDGFLDYAVLGIREFAVKNIHYNISSIIGLVAIALIVIVMTIFIRNNKQTKSEEKDKLLLITCISIPMLLSSYPIFNTYHIGISIYVIVIDIIYILDIAMFRDILNENKILNMIIVMFISIVSIVSMFYLTMSVKQIVKNNIFKYKDYYFGAFFSDENRYNEYVNVMNYIKEQDNNVIVLSYKAALYMIPLERSNGAMDLPFYGNMGENGEENMIKLIENTSNTKILILDNIENIHGQESTRINRYIRDNLNYIGKIEEFDIFENNKK